MSQSHQPTDSQALLQSMLQKLNLQVGIDGQARLQTPAPTAAASTLGQDGARGASNLQNNSGNVFGFNNIPSKEFTTPAANLKQQPGAGYERGRTSFLSQNVSFDGQMGKSRVLRLDSQSGFDPKEMGPTKDINIASFKRTYSERPSFDGSVMTNHISPFTQTVSSTSLNQSPAQGFAPGTAGEGNKVLHMENGGFSGLKQSSDVQSFSSSQITTNSRKKQRSSENKTRRWTQRLKERWKEKHSKKEKEDRGTEDQRTEKGIQISNPDQVTMGGNFMNAPNNHGETAFVSMDRFSPNKLFPAQTEDNTRHSSVFDIGLGSFSLLEEIIRGQEWGKFINPNLPTTSVHPRPSEETLSQPKIQPSPYGTDQSPRALNQLGGKNSRWSFSTESSPAPVCSPPQTAPAFQTVGMDVSAGKQQPFVYREANQPELMEDGRNQLDTQSRGNGLQHRASASSESGDALYNPVLKVRRETSRKRHHQPVEMRDERVQKERRSDGGEAGRVSAGSMSSPFPPSSSMMEDSTESQQGNVMPFHALRSPPLSPSSSNLFAPAPRGVLKHSVSQESEASVETMTKKRRVEENRRVHFSEQVVAIESPNLDMDFTDSEEDSGEEEDSLIEQDCEEGQAAAEEEVLQPRRPALPAWIKALKRMNAGKKHR